MVLSDREMVNQGLFTFIVPSVILSSGTQRADQLVCRVPGFG